MTDKQDTPRTERVLLWMEHLDIHLTEHDLRHAGLALRTAWPIAKEYIEKLERELTALRAKLAAERDKALEDAAKVCDDETDDGWLGTRPRAYAEMLAKRIRALKSTGES